MSNRILAIIIDDEATARTTLRRMLERYCPDVDVVAEGNGVVSGAKAIRQFKPDLVFLDIQFGSDTGFDLLEVLGDIDFALVFVTAFNEYAVQAFKFNALDYLLKPIDPTNLKMTVAQVRNLQKEATLSMRLKHLQNSLQDDSPNVLTVNNDEGYFFLPTNQIIRVESKGGGVTSFICDQEPPVHVAKNIGEYSNILPEPPFFRTHQSHVVNLNWVASYLFEDGGTVVMRDQARVPLARRRKDAFLSLIQRLGLK